MVQATSTAHYMVVRKHIHRRSRLLVRPFVAMPDNLYLILRLTRSAISGSSALRFMLPVTSCSWTCKDLDIYTPEGKSAMVVNFFKLEGYKVSKRSKFKGPYRAGSFDVTTMIKGHLSVDVVTVKHSSFFSAISRFHLTCLINFLSADGFFSAYPTLTASEHSIVSYLSFAEFGGIGPRDTTIVAYRKYQDRGFKLLYLPESADTGLPRTDGDAPSHTCGKSAWCPHTPRTTNDSHCLYVPFDPNPSSVTFDKLSKRGLYSSRSGTIWILGGPSCDGEFNHLRPLSSTRGYDSD